MQLKWKFGFGGNIDDKSRINTKERWKTGGGIKKNILEIEEVNKLLEPRIRTVNMYAIENYYSGTSLDGFVENLVLKISQNRIVRERNHRFDFIYSRQSYKIYRCGRI